MPAMLDDPAAAPIWRVSGDGPFPTMDNNMLPHDIYPRQVILRDRITTATLLPFSSSVEVPPGLLSYMADQLNREIEKGDTYPMVNSMSVQYFGQYWFQNFGAIMIMGDVLEGKDLFEIEQHNRGDWSKQCLGSFYVKPNYPGRSSHVCNGGFLVTDAARNKGVGRLMGECYLEWAPKLGYTYSVFNLVYETNVASCKIWDALGFKRIGRVKGCGNLRSHDELVDAIIYGRELGPEGEDLVVEERFDKFRFYLKNGKYPAGADRAEKSRLRSAATHYKLLPSLEPEGEERLMLKDKEVISDPQKQYEIARALHVQSHGGINKTTATVAEKYHWVRIKDTVSMVIKNCIECKETNRVATARAEATQSTNQRRNNSGSDPNQDIERIVNFDALPQSQQSMRSPLDTGMHDHQMHDQIPAHAAFAHDVPLYHDMPLDPRMMQYNPGSLDHTIQPNDDLLHNQGYNPHQDHSLGTGLVLQQDVDDLEQQLLDTSSFGHSV